ncbi:MAG TPA: DegV family protein [Bellilinea sp.]
MSKVAIVTDSTSNLPDDLVSQYSIHTIPLQLIWAGDNYRDGLDITPLEFYTRLKTAKEMPSSSQPSPADFQRVYTELLEQGYDIVSIHISSKLSGTLDSAIQAKNTLGTDRIALIDSASASMALGFLVLTAARAVRDGASFDEVVRITESAVPRTGVFFVVSTLEFLHRGGRIGGAAAFLGTALGLKPILMVNNGRVDAKEKVRTMNKALNRVTDILVENVGSQKIHLSVLHANAPDEAELLLQNAKDHLPPGSIVESLITPVSPVIGTHTGPGTVGFAYMLGD